MAPVPVVGFDLDMTLINTADGFARVLAVLGEELGLDLPVQQMTSNLGPPLDRMLEPYLSVEAVGPAIDRFRVLYPDHAVPAVPLLPGAREAFEAVRRHGGTVLVVTGKFTPNARLHLDHLGLSADVLVGEVWGAGKAAALREHGARCYVGDHVHDVEGARAAGVPSISVLTGGSTREELVAAGTDVLLDSLLDFPAWLDGHLAG